MTDAAIFDFDGTMAKGDSIIAFLRYAFSQGCVRLPDAVRALSAGVRFKMGLCTALQSKNAALSFARHMPPDRFDALCAAFARERLLPAIFPEARKRIRNMHARGTRVCIATASPEPYMQYVAQDLNVSLIATVFDESLIALENCEGARKAELVRMWLSLLPNRPSSVTVFGNSLSDLPMLKLADRPVCVNPTSALRRAAPHMTRQRWRV